MRNHWHTGIDAVLIYGVSAIIVINLVRLLAAKMAMVDGPVGTIGTSIGALVHFGS